MLLEKPDRTRGFKKERILRVLLTHSRGEMSKYRIAKEADVSEPWVLEYTGRLEQEGIIEDTTVIQPRELYEAWLKTRIKPSQVDVSFQQPMQLLEEMDLAYALTTYRGENLLQGFLFPSTVDIYVQPEQAQAWTRVIEEKGLLGGGNTRIRVTDEHVFYQTETHDNHPVVCIPQLIVDLLDEGGPCEEAAEKLIASYHA